MKLSEKGINLLKQLEGCIKNGDKHVVYDDKTGKPVALDQQLPSGATIGYGHLLKKGENFIGGISEQSATDLLRQDLVIAEHAVQNNILVPINQNQFDALVILVFNIGTKNFTNSTIVKYINDKNFQSFKYPTLESAWLAWNKSGGKEMPGLTNRRNQEWKLFNE